MKPPAGEPAAIPGLPQLETVCSTCAGTRKVGVINEASLWSPGAECPTCRGAGLVPTAAGAAILSFMRRYERS